MLKVDWNPTIVKPYGANVAVIGFIGSGKTTLMKNMFSVLRECGKLMSGGDCLSVRANLYHARSGEIWVPDSEEIGWKKIDLPFKMLVHGTQRILNDDWKGYPIRKRRVSLTGDKFKYLMSGNEKAVVLFEDLPTWFTEGENIDWVTMNNFLAGVRHWDSVFFVSAQTLSDYLDNMPSPILGKITHIILFNTAEDMLRLSRWGIPMGACAYFNSLVKNITERHYITIDLRQKIVTKPMPNTDPCPLLRMLIRKNSDEEVENLSGYWIRSKSSGRKRSDPTNRPLPPKIQKVVDLLKENPMQDLRELAEQVEMPVNTLYQWTSRLKKRGYLASDIRYGTTRTKKDKKDL